MAIDKPTNQLTNYLLFRRIESYAILLLICRYAFQKQCKEFTKVNIYNDKRKQTMNHIQWYKISKKQ
ncbi:hypothetical protein T01_15833 [Trichinella spiralis]|uniref:Uncharacterized protein n=1 Tax=Trichinella spiralis TaxID=6334 RepID=A0A0V1ARU9_TRISP|nr:hypothetical protein T01_15833 [Trichinella spiralis]